MEATISGVMKISGHEFRLRVHLPEAFPLCLPEIEVEKTTVSASLPHMWTGHRLCVEAEAHLLDRYDPWGIVREALLHARQLLTDMISGDRAKEFAQEAVAYWATSAGQRRIDCIVEPGEHPHPTVALFRGETLCAVADDPGLYAWSLPERTSAGLTQRNALYIPLDPASTGRSFTLDSLRHLDGLRAHVRALPDKNRRILQMLLGRGSGREEFLVLGLKRPDGERALLGLRLIGIQGGHPLADHNAQAEVQPYHLLRRDLSFLAPRGGATTDLQKRRVLIAGCGSVGGYLALMLARAGVGALSLVDQDRFELENTYRHACGMARLGEPKVLGLKSEIERAVPYVAVTQYPGKLESLLKQQPSLLREHDLVISALGNPTIELHLNELLWKEDLHAPALFAWLEPLGLGGHVLVTHVRSESALTRGCLQCLYHRPIEGGAIENRAAFAKTGVTYTRDTLGCGSRYLPFADLDAQRTAELAARLALQVLRGELTGAPILSWKGDRRAFEQARHSVTERYAADPARLEADRLLYVREDCPVCARR